MPKLQLQQLPHLDVPIIQRVTKWQAHMPPRTRCQTPVVDTHSHTCYATTIHFSAAYRNGSQVKTGAKVMPGNIVRIEVDMDVGTMRYIIDGKDQGIMFDNLAVSVDPLLHFPRPPSPPPPPPPPRLIGPDVGFPSAPRVHVQGNEVYPAVAFYSTDRSISLVKVEGPTTGGGASVRSPLPPALAVSLTPRVIAPVKAGCRQ